MVYSTWGCKIQGNNVTQLKDWSHFGKKLTQSPEIVPKLELYFCTQVKVIFLSKLPGQF